MNKYRLIQEKNPDNDFDKATKIEFEVETETWGELLEYFEDFLKGCGYHLSGKLGIVEEE